METYDLVVLLGSQVKLRNDHCGYELAQHTQLKAEAAAIALKMGITEKMIISGGYNFGVRYNNQEVLTKPDFSFSAFAKARREYTSEAAAMAGVILKSSALNPASILLEELSATTEENAAFVAIMLKRTPTFTGVKKIAILTLLYHMERALPIFKKAGLEVEPLFAENLLTLWADKNQEATWKETSLNRISEYYKTPRGGKQYDTEQSRQLLSMGKSLQELIS